MDRTVCSPPHLHGKMELRLVVGWAPSRQPLHCRLVLVPAPRRHSSPYSLTLRDRAISYAFCIVTRDWYGNPFAIAPFSWTTAKA